MTDLEVCRDLIKNHEHKGVVRRCLFIELRLMQDRTIDPQILKEMRDIHAGGEIP